MEEQGFVLRLQENGEVRYALPHAKLREVLYNGLAEDRRAELHARSARHLREAPSAEESPEAWAALAAHSIHAGDAEAGKDFALRAVERFEKLRLHNEAIRLLELVLSIPLEPEERRELSFRLSLALYNAGRLQAVVDLMEHLREEGGEDLTDEDRVQLHFFVARATSSMGIYDVALQHLDVVGGLLGPETSPSRWTAFHTLYANILVHLGSYDRARALCEKAMERLDRERHASHVASVLDCLGFLCRAEGDLNQSLEYSQKVHEISLELGDPKLAFQSVDGLSVIQSMLGNYRESLRFGRKAVKLAEEQDDMQARSVAYGNLAMTYTALGRLGRARELFERASRLAERAGDTHKLAVGLFNIANVLDGLGSFERGTGYYLRSLELAEKVGDVRLEILGKTCFTWHHLMQWETASAEGMLVEAKQREEEGPNRFSEAMVEEVESRLHFHTGELGRAIELVRKAQEIFEGLDFTERIVDCRIHLARILCTVGALDDAQSQARQALEEADKRGSALYRAQSRAMLAEIALARSHVAEGEAGLAQAQAEFHKLESRAFHQMTVLRLARSRAERGNLRGAAETLKTIEGEMVEATDTTEVEAEAGYVKGIMLLGGADPDVENGLVALRRSAAVAEKSRAADLTLRANLALARALREMEEWDEASERYGRAEAVLGRMPQDLPPALREVFDGNPSWTAVSQEIADFRAATVRKKKAPTFTSVPVETKIALPGVPSPEPIPETCFRSLSDLVKKFGDEEQRENFGKLEEGYRNLVRLQEIISLLGRENDLGKVLSTVLDAAVEMTGSLRGFIILSDDWSRDLDEMDIVVARNIDREEVRGPALKISRSIAAEVGRKRRPLVINEAAEDPRFAAAGSVLELELRSVVCIPLHEPNRVNGVLYLDNRFEPDVYSEQDLVILQSLAQQSAVAIARTRLYEGLLRERERVGELNAQLHSMNRELEDRIQTQIVEMDEIRRQLKLMDEDLRLRFSYENIVGRSNAMQKVFRLLDKIIDTELPVLIIGPTGSGKELVARTIHYQGARREGSLVSENCAALPDTLLESELFGYVRGAFTGADVDKRGLLELANGGSLFLDEIGEMSPGMQKKLLRALEQKEIRRVGGKEIIPLDIRIITATNRDLAAAVEEGTFRQDLFYRLNTFTVRIPSLGDRTEDIPLLLDHFLTEGAEAQGLEKPELPPRVLEILLNYPWPGNVRELRNEVERILALGGSGDVAVDDLSPRLVRSARAEADPLFHSGDEPRFDSAVAKFEVALLRRALEENGWNVVKTARQLGINRMKLSRKIKKYNISKGDSP
jgi:transcriptional regulator with GAF, ATPase, and Fis domain/tetratricopeptide (TPR) repeat protein